MRILHLSDTHGIHHKIKNMPPADVLIHSGDISHSGSEEEVLDFLNWFIDLDYPQKIFVTGNHDICLWDAVDIEDLPDNVHFLQDRSITVNGFKIFGIGYDHSEMKIPKDADIVVTHEPPIMILDKSAGVHWGNAPLRNRIFEIKPRLHLFGHAHESYGTLRQEGILFSNAALLNEMNRLVREPRILEIQ